MQPDKNKIKRIFSRVYIEGETGCSPFLLQQHTDWKDETRIGSCYKDIGQFGQGKINFCPLLIDFIPEACNFQ